MTAISSSDPKVMIHAPVVAGSGVAIVHRALATRLRGYVLRELDPRLCSLPVLTRVFRKPDAAIVHSSADLGPWVAGRNAQLVATFHSYSLDKDFLRTFTPLRRLHRDLVLRNAILRSIRRAAVLTAVSRFASEIAWRELSLRTRPTVIYNGVDTERFRPLNRDARKPVRILFAGNPTRQKGSEHLRAVAEALPKNVELAVTGGMRSTGLQRPEAHERLVLLPPIAHEDMPEIYQRSSMLFFPTSREGFGLAVAEAMACGLPIVATRCSSLPELVDHGKGGFLFDEGNLGQMLDYLVRLSRDPGLRFDMGAYNRAKVVAEFDQARMVDGYREIFAACSNSA